MPETSAPLEKPQQTLTPPGTHPSPLNNTIRQRPSYAPLTEMDPSHPGVWYVDGVPVLDRDKAPYIV